MADGAPPEYRAINLGKPTRWVSGVLGLAAGGAGGYSVFVNTNQAGSTAMLLLGGIFLLIALTGRVPERIGKDGLDYKPTAEDAAAQDAVNELMDSEVDAVRVATAEAFSRSLEAQLETSASTPERVRPAPIPGRQTYSAAETTSKARAIQLEQSIENLLISHFSPDAVERQPSFATDDGLRFRLDSAVTLPNGKRIAVETRIGTTRVADLALFGILFHEHGFQGLIVVRANPPKFKLVRSERTEERFPHVRIVDIEAELGELSDTAVSRILNALNSFE